MNLANNRKSVFYNLFELISCLSEEERIRCSSFLREKRNVTKNNYLFGKIVSETEKGAAAETVDEHAFRKQLKEEVETDFNRLVQNLYERLLIFIAEIYKTDSWKSWQIQANQHLLEIESLCSRGLYSQAKGHLLKLEDRIKASENYRMWIWDDIGIYSRLANLKIGLKNLAPDLYSIDETDEILHNLLKTGDYFYCNELNRPVQHSFARHKMIGYQLLVQHFVQQDKYREALAVISENLISTEKDNEISESEKSVLKQYLLLYEIFLRVKNRESHDDISFAEWMDGFPAMPQLMLLEQLVYEIRFALALGNRHSAGFIQQNSPYGLFCYSAEKINSFHLRKEINYAVMLFLAKDYSGCLKLIVNIKKEIKNRLGLEYRILLFLEAFTGILTDNSVTVGILDGISSSVNGKEAFLFEQMALKLLKKWPAMSGDQHRKAVKDEDGPVAELALLADRTDVLHSLVLYTFTEKL